ncbi:MAG: class I SAM-dependent methyltransferase [Candidatus Eisenbacteria bacterium]|nr:class I SAM-dependent methyltransferase [Candidatus Eisenbacteria bacterium]
MPKPIARTQDRHRLYEASVQNPDEEVRFIRRVYKQRYGRTPVFLREDFCGTAAVCARWVKSFPENRAVGVDLDEETLEWGRRNNIEPLGRAAEQVRLILGDVRSRRAFRPEVVAAMNFSYFVFKDRAALLDYYRRVRRSLRPEGMFVFDIYGGPESQIPQEEETDYDDFTYVWDQDHYDPVTGAYRCYIHFRFPDGSRIRKAFAYDWRLWTLTEVQDLLREAGFSETRVYWEGTDEDGDGNGVFRPVKKGDDAISWVAYVTAFC